MTIHLLVLAKACTGTQIEVRLKSPLTFWADQYHHVVNFLTFSEYKLSDIIWSDIIIVERHLTPAVVDVLYLAQRYAKIIIYDVDDNFFKIPEHLKHHQAGLIAYSYMAESLIPYFDAVFVSTSRLYQYYMQLHSEIFILNNAVKTDCLLPPSIDNEIKKYTILIASSDQMVTSYLIPALKKLKANYGNHLEVLVMGPMAKKLALEGVSFTEKKILSYQSFREFISTIKNPIGLIPVDQSEFSQCKTIIKFLDYIAAGIPVICSNLPPFSDSLKTNVDAILTANTSTDWYDSIEALIQDTSIRKKLVVNAQRLAVDQFSLDDSSRLLNKWFTQTLKLNTNKHQNKVLMLPYDRLLNKVHFYLLHLLHPSSYVVVFQKTFNGFFKK